MSNDMKCQKVPKNPCKICLQKVTNKNGIQCKGVCHTWAHFKCLNYTPGKIQDIKSGVIKVMCPCPNCDTNEAKEVLTKPPYSCTNFKCPANSPPICEVKECASKVKPIPYCPSCGPVSDTTCKASQSPPKPKCMQTSKCESPPVVYEYAPDPKDCIEESTQVCPSQKQKQAPIKDECFTPSIGSSTSRSCSDIPKDPPCQKPKARPTSSDSKVAASKEDYQKLMYSAIQNLCKNVGNLSAQLKDLMCRLDNCVQ